MARMMESINTVVLSGSHASLELTVPGARRIKEENNNSKDQENRYGVFLMKNLTRQYPKRVNGLDTTPSKVPPSPADVRTLDAPSSLNFSGDTHGGCLVKVRSLQAHRGWKSPALLQGHPECECSLPMAALPSESVRADIADCSLIAVGQLSVTQPRGRGCSEAAPAPDCWAEVGRGICASALTCCLSGGLGYSPARP
ncbi:unnamed protein product [Boreogadus saida]